MRLEHLLSGAVTLTLPNPQVILGRKRKKEKTRIKEDKDRRRFVRQPLRLPVLRTLFYGGLAQLARALAWHARGHRFDPDILHTPLERAIDL